MRTITTTDRSQSAKPTAPKREGNVLSNQQITYRVGSFTTIAAIVLLYGWGWLHSLSLFHPPQRFKVKFHDIAGLNKNAPVNINGVRVGTVETVVLQPPHGEDPRACVLIGLKINTENVQIPHGSEFTIQTLGLVGAKYVEITLPEKAADPNDAIRKEEVIVGEDPVRVELVVNKIATNLASIDYSGVEHEFAQKLERVAKAADGVEDATHRIGKVADEAQGAARNANAFFARGKDSFPKLETTATHMTALTDDL
ncbi:MAG TPA: MlaD family protein, partial [Chroococcales cyanobacterium]